MAYPVQRAPALRGVWGRVLVASLILACAMRGDRDWSQAVIFGCLMFALNDSLLGKKGDLVWSCPFCLLGEIPRAPSVSTFYVHNKMLYVVSELFASELPCCGLSLGSMGKTAHLSGNLEW